MVPRGASPTDYMSQWEVIYEEPGTRETYQGIPGRLHTPTPRDDGEMLEAMKFLLERKRPVKFTIRATEHLSDAPSVRP